MPSHRALILFALTLLIPLRLSASVMDSVSDDFNDNALDGSKWYTVLPRVASKVLEQNQRIELTARGYLVSQIQPKPSAANPLTVTGEYVFNNVDPNSFDFLDITTRTSATPAGGSNEVTNGISFTFWGTGNLVIIDRAANAQLGPAVGGFPVVAGQPYSFTVQDDGLNVSIAVQEVGGPVLATTAGASSYNAASNHVLFYNREFFNDTGYLDNVVIQTVPEPTAASLLAIAAGGGLLRRRRKVNSSS